MPQWTETTKNFYIFGWFVLCHIIATWACRAYKEENGKEKGFEHGFADLT